MSPKEDLNDIVQNFVDHDLASLDRVGGESDSFTLSPHLAQPSPDLALDQGIAGASSDNKFAPASTSSSQKPSSSALTGPSSSNTPASGTGSSNQFSPSKTDEQSQTPADNSINSSKVSSPQENSSSRSSELKNIESQAQNASSHPNSLGNQAASANNSPSVKSPSNLSKEASAAGSNAESKVLPKARGSQNDPLVAAVEDQNSRQVSTHSTASSATSENRKSFGNKLKAFGKRIASGSSSK